MNHNCSGTTNTNVNVVKLKASSIRPIQQLDNRT